MTNIKYLIAYCGIINALWLAGQIKVGNTIRGVVIDDQNNEPVPFVNIGILNSSVGTSSDHQGEFSLTIPEGSAQQTIIFSCINYKTRSLSINELSSLQGRQIRLVEDTLDLVAMVFSDLDDPEQILIKAFNRNNDEGYLIKQYYQGKVYDSEGKGYFDLDAFLHYRKEARSEGGYSISNCAVHKKNNLGQDKNGIVDNAYFQYFMFYYNVSDYSYHCDLGENECLNKLKISFDKYVLYDGKQCYKIDYQFEDTRKLSIGRNGLKSMLGTTYIDPETFELIRWEIEGEYEDLSEKKLQKMDRKGHPMRFRWTRNYRQVDGSYYLSLLNVIQENKALNSQQEPITISMTHSCMSMDVIFDTEEAFQEELSSCEPYNINQVTYDEAFWQATIPKATTKNEY